MDAGPTSRVYFSQRLRLHYVDWGNEEAPLLLLIHGGRDHCRNWDWVAQALKDDYHVIAPDLRGHGDSQWMVGGTYMHMDFVYDIAQLVHQVATDKVTIVSHSLGGAISAHYTGMQPEKVEKLVLIEGLGPPPEIKALIAKTPLHERINVWVEDLRRASGRLPRRYQTLDDALKRMQDENPHLSESQARHLTLHGANRNEDGTYSWKFDNYVRVFSPLNHQDNILEGAFGRIECPVLLVHGLQSVFAIPDESLLARFKDVRLEKIDNAGHWVHHDQLDEFLRILRKFL
ncbi:MAG: alpha/beta hydrolase [Gammaproteobacteria bacterium]|nr:alpha/beta hydrolase [Gammaproteobacteria bacterium]MCY4322576.1 alpha/beta hydrolase [Gammaproteobacteria bacterium]